MGRRFARIPDMVREVEGPRVQERQGLPGGSVLEGRVEGLGGKAAACGGLVGRIRYWPGKPDLTPVTAISKISTIAAVLAVCL